MSIVMGLDQHRAQITAEWIDLATGELSRGRVVPADRAGVLLAGGAQEVAEVLGVPLAVVACLGIVDQCNAHAGFAPCGNLRVFLRPKTL